MATRIKRRNPGTPARFPLAFRRIIDHFKLSGPEAADITYTLETPEQATKLRFMWYNFLKALRADSREDEDMRIAESIIVKKREGTLIFASRDMEVDICGLDAVLDQMGVGRPGEHAPSLTGMIQDSIRPKTDDDLIRELFMGEEP